MSRTLEELLNDVLALEKRKKPQEPSPVFNTNNRTVELRQRTGGISRTKELPSDLVHELQLPYAVEGIYNQLKSFQSNNRHKPFIQLSTGTVVYLEFEEMPCLVRLYLGQHNTLKIRGNEQLSGAFEVEDIFEYQYMLGGGSLGEDLVRMRNRKPEDLLSAPDRAQGKAVVPVICFQFFDRNAGVSTHSIKPEYSSKGDLSQSSSMPVKKREIC